MRRFVTGNRSSSLLARACFRTPGAMRDGAFESRRRACSKSVGDGSARNEEARGVESAPDAIQLARRADRARIGLGPGRRARIASGLGLGVLLLFSIDGLVHWGEPGWRGWAARLAWIGLAGLAIVQALGQARARRDYCEVLQRLPAPILLTDAGGRVLLCNRAADQLLGVPAGGVVGSAMENLFSGQHGEDLALDRSSLLEGLAGARGGVGLPSKGREMDLFQPQGGQRSVRVEQALLRTQWGPLLRIALSEARPEVLREGEGLGPEEVMAASHDAVLVVNAEGVIEAGSRAVEDLWGRCAEDMLGSPLWSIAPPEREREVRRILERVLAGESVRGLLSEHVAGGGRRLYVSVNAEPLPGRGGASRREPHRAVFSLRDMTRGLRAQALVEELNLALSSVLPARALVDANGRILWANASLGSLLGNTDDTPAARGQAWLEIFPPGTRARLERAFSEMLAVGLARASVQVNPEVPGGCAAALDVFLVRRLAPDDRFEGHHLFLRSRAQGARGETRLERACSVGTGDR